MPNLAVVLPVPKLSYFGNDVPNLGGSSDDITWDNGMLILWDDGSHITWDSAGGVASSDIFFTFSYPKTQYTGSV